MLILLSLLALLLGVASAAAGEVSRDSYREAVEPICKANTEANQRILKGVRAEVRDGRLNAAAARFDRAGSALRKAVRRLAGVPRPPADRALLAEWLADVKGEAALFERIAAKLRGGDKVGAQRLVVILTRNANVANNLVIPFEFEYCRLEPGRFT
jgi:hypothetical protein